MTTNYTSHNSYWSTISTFRFPSYLKNDVKEQLKFDFKKHISFEAYQKGYYPILPPGKPKPQPSVKFYSKKFSVYLSSFKIESNIATQEDEQQDSIDEEIEAKIKGRNRRG